MQLLTRSLLARSLPLAGIVAGIIAPNVQAQVLDNTFVTRLRNVSLTTADFAALVCQTGGYSFIGSTTIAGVPDPTRICNALSTVDATGFFSTTTPIYYKVEACEAAPPGGQRSYIVVGNLLATTGDFSTANSNSQTFPTTTTTSLTLDGCAINAYNFMHPSWFTPAAVSQPTIAFTNALRRVGTVPRNTINTNYARDMMTFGAVRVGSGSALTIPFTTGGTAVRETHYFLRESANDPNPVQSYLIPAGTSVDYFLAYVPYESTNHAERTVTVTFTSPAGYNVVTPNTVMGRILELNLASVGIAPIGNKATLTPGATSGDGFTLTRTGGDSTQPLAVNYTIAGTAANGTDYGYLNGTVTIPANTTSLNIPVVVPVPTGSTAQAAKTIALTITSVDGSYNETTTPGNTTTLTIPAYNPAAVTIAATGTTTLAPGSSGSVTVTRTGGDTTQPLTVNLTTTGTAVAGTDYELLPSTVTFPANQTTVTIPVVAKPKTGSTATTTTTLAVAIGSGQGYTAGTANSATYTIGAYTPSTVSLNGTGGTLTPGSTTDGFTITRAGGDTTQPLVVTYTTGGTATPGSDYTPLSGTTVIPAGQTTTTIPLQVAPNSGTTAEPAETITIALQSGNGYTIGSTTTATYTIPAYTPPAGAPTVTVSAPNGTTLIPGQTTNALTFTRTGATTAALPVYYTLGGTATAGNDYSGLSGQVTIPAGQASVTLPISTPTTATTGKTIGVTLATPGSAYAAGTNTQATYTIGSRMIGDPPAPRTTYTVAIDYGIPAIVITRVGGDLSQPASLPLIIGGDAQPGYDYASLPGTVSFASGQTTVTVPLTVLPGATNGRTVTASLPTGETASYTITNAPVPPRQDTPQPTTNPLTSSDDNSGNGGSALAPIAGVAGVGGILAATGVFSSGGMAAAASGFAAVPDYCVQAKGEIEWNMLPGTNGGIVFARPDVTFSRLGLSHTTGQVKVKGQTIAWGGASNPSTPAEALKLGNLEGVYNLQCLNLAQIEKASGKKLSDKPLGETGLLRSTTLVNLSRTAYHKAKTVGEIPGMVDMLAKKLPQGSTLTKAAIAPMSFAELLQQVPALGQINLGSMAIGQIPGLMQIPIANFADWKNFAVSEVPGLADVPFSQFPTKPAEQTSQPSSRSK